jgi:deoxyribodipyrimidine photo-lyase
MQASQRAAENPALEHAVRRANALGLPVVVGFGLMDDYPEANLRHYTFMLQGLAQTGAALARRSIQFVLRHGHPADVALQLGSDAALIVADRGYLRHQKQWRERVAIEANCAVDQVEGDVVVPVEVTSDKAEFAARTIRPKLKRHLDDYLVALKPTPVKHGSLDLAIKSLDFHDPAGVLERLKLDRSVPAVTRFPGGPDEAKRVLDRFLTRHLKHYAEHRKRPETDDVSRMSQFLHFGQISPVTVARKVQQAKHGKQDDRATYLEELIIRRELSCNFVHFNPRYDRYEALPDWARQSLAAHRRDKRPALYTMAQLEAAQTADPYWNAAMREMVTTGYMHNYMRMYWGKKILEWSPDPRTAFDRTLHLNNTYFLDGRDPNSFANVAWIFGLHDRGWKERPVYGKVRYMSQGGLERKADPEAYVQKVDRLAHEAQPA